MKEAEAFAVAKRHLKLTDSEVIQAGNYLGSLLHRLGDKPELKDELRELAKAFQNALSGDGK